MAKSITKGKEVRITNINDGKKKFPRRYLDRVGVVTKVDRKNQLSKVKFNNRLTELEVPLENLEVAR